RQRPHREYRLHQSGLNPCSHGPQSAQLVPVQGRDLGLTELGKGRPHNQSPKSLSCFHETLRRFLRIPEACPTAPTSGTLSEYATPKPGAKLRALSKDL